MLCHSGREDDTLPGEGQCQWRVTGRAWGLRSVQSGVWAQRLCQDHGEQGSAPQADGRGRGELLEARAPRFLRRAQAPRPHTPEMPQKSQHSTVQTAHFRRTLKRAKNPVDGSCCQRWDRERGASTAEGLPCPREGAAAAASQPSEPCLTSELVSKKAMAARQGTGRRRKPREQSAGTNAHGSAPSLPAGAARSPRWQGVCCPTLQACESGLPTAGTGNTTASYVRLRKNHGRSEKSRRSLNIVSGVAFLLWESSLYPVFNTLGPSLPPPNVSPPRLILPSGAPDDPSPPGNTPAY